MSTNDCGRSVLILGCGNDLRGDDAVGRLVANAIDAQEMPGVKVFSVGQYTPDFASDLAQVNLAIFIDACEEIANTGVRVRKLKVEHPAPGSTHHAEPSQLLGMAEWLFGSAPEAYAIDIPAVHFEFTETLTPIAARGVDDALVEVKRLIAVE